MKARQVKRSIHTSTNILFSVKCNENKVVTLLLREKNADFTHWCQCKSCIHLLCWKWSCQQHNHHQWTPNAATTFDYSYFIIISLFHLFFFIIISLNEFHLRMQLYRTASGAKSINGTFASKLNVILSGIWPIFVV